MSKIVISLNDVEIPCFQIRKGSKIKQVSVAQDIEVPGKTEMLVDVYVNRIEADGYDTQAEYLIEPLENFANRYQLVTTATLVDINRATTCKIRVLNPFNYSIELKQDAEIAKAEKVDSVLNTVAETENPDETEILNRIRKVDNMPRKMSHVKLPFEPSTEDKIPEHIRDLFVRSTQRVSENEKQAVAGLLVKYSDIFSKNEWDIGLTHLNEVAIDTGDAKPNRQKPRLVPLAFANEEKEAIEHLLKKGVIQKST